jgi:NAD-dependent dihydropyrimidine dehydrogenase PreA subunit
VQRQIIRIDEDLCTGCGECIPNCPEGALQIIDGKARLISDLFCDGLGACIGHCPEGAITTETREAHAYDESKVMENIVRQGPNVISAHLSHLKDHAQDEYFREALAYLVENDVEIPAQFLEPPCRCGEIEEPKPQFAGCPGSRLMDLGARPARTGPAEPDRAPASRPSRLGQWPVQIMLVPPQAPFLKGADVLVAADCVPFAYADFHETLLRGKVLLVGCPKLDDAALYREKLTEMFRRNDVRSVTVAHMEVPCCFGMVKLVESAIEASGKSIPLETSTIGVKGDVR